MPPGWWVLPAALLWAGVLALPWRPWSTRERLEAARSPGAAPVPARPDHPGRPDHPDHPDRPDRPDRPEHPDHADGDDPARVTALVPARDEADVIGECLAGLAAQGPGLRVVVVDDRSADGTAAAVRAAGLDRLTLVAGAPLPAGWSGKVWALEQGLAHVDTPLALLVDADVRLAPGLLAALRERRRETGAALVSLMVELPATRAWERLLLPPFVYFFKLLYPFRLANRPRSRVAAAAGGCVLVETAALRRAGAFESLRAALIDDCALAARVKGAGGRTWIGLTRSARALRRREGPAGIGRMVARTAFTQLGDSTALLLVCTVVMLAAFVLPAAGLVAGVAAGETAAALAGATALACMALSYAPTLRYYGLPLAWSLTLPVAGVLYLAMTWASAVRYWAGERSRWKGRRYAVAAGPAAGGAGETGHGVRPCGDRS